MTLGTERGGSGIIKEQHFHMLLKLSWYKSKSECYNVRMLNVIPMITIKKVIEYSLKELRREYISL